MSAKRIGRALIREGARMVQEGARIMGKSKTVKSMRGKQPIEYRLMASFEMEKLEDGSKVSGSVTLPIRKGAGARLARYTKEDVADILRQLAEVVEKGDYAAFGSNLDAVIRAGMESTKNRKTVAN